MNNEDIKAKGSGQLPKCRIIISKKKDLLILTS